MICIGVCQLSPTNPVGRRLLAHFLSFLLYGPEFGENLHWHCILFLLLVQLVPLADCLLEELREVCRRSIVLQPCTTLSYLAVGNLYSTQILAREPESISYGDGWFPLLGWGIGFVFGFVLGRFWDRTYSLSRRGKCLSFCLRLGCSSCHATSSRRLWLGIGRAPSYPMVTIAVEAARVRRSAPGGRLASAPMMLNLAVNISCLAKSVGPGSQAS